MHDAAAAAGPTTASSWGQRAAIDVQGDFRLPLGLVGEVSCQPLCDPIFIALPEGVFVCDGERLRAYSPDLRTLRWLQSVGRASSMVVAGHELFLMESRHDGGGSGGVTVSSTRVHVFARDTGDPQCVFDVAGTEGCFGASWDGSRLLFVRPPPAGCVCVDAGSGRALWTVAGSLQKPSLYAPGRQFDAVLAVPDGFVVAPNGTATIRFLDASSGALRWEAPLPPGGAGRDVPGVCHGLRLVSPSRLLVRSSGQDLLRVDLENGETLTTRLVGDGWTSPDAAFVSAEAVFERGRFGLTVIDVHTLRDIERHDWSRDFRRAGEWRGFSGLVVSPRALIWTSSNRLVGIHRPGKRGGGRRVWMLAVGEGPLPPISTVGPYVYASSGGTPGRVPGAPGKGGAVHCLGSADIVDRSRAGWSRPWRRAEDRRSRWLTRQRDE